MGQVLASGFNPIDQALLDRPGLLLLLRILLAAQVRIFAEHYALDTPTVEERHLWTKALAY
ncbi:hypothetical protein [Pseudomonas sp. NPDC079086]|uniref:hypothetical protein n=1 Tax=unclassified Pseudomonas TaxID=196821 RepID=UPI0037C6BE67